MKKHILTSEQAAQYPLAGQNTQNVIVRKLYHATFPNISAKKPKIQFVNEFKRSILNWKIFKFVLVKFLHIAN